MANRTDIFDRLRQYEVQPPPEAFHLLMDRLQAETALEKDNQWQGAFHGLQELEVQPPAFMAAAVANAVAETNLFTGLQHLSIDPPAGAFERILDQVAGKKTGILRSLFTPFRAIAAAIVLVMAGAAIYYFLPGQLSVQPPAGLAWQTNEHPAPVVDTVQQAPVVALPDSVRYKIYDNAKAENYFKNNKFMADGNRLQLVDNDFIVTFASYQYDALPAFLIDEEEGSDLLVRLDQYSYFTISENMLRSLKKMYEQRRRGTPTRRARKEREKLEQWKRADEARFDVRQANPLDPIELAEFIFK